MTEESIAKIDGWYIVEIFGHAKYAGYVSTVAIGSEAMIRVDVPELPARDKVVTGYEYHPKTGERLPVGSTIAYGPTQPYSKIFGVKAVYSLTPCSEAACLKAVEEIQPRPLLRVDIPSLNADQKTIEAPAAERVPSSIDDGGEDGDDEDARIAAYEAQFGQ